MVLATYLAPLQGLHCTFVSDAKWNNTARRVARSQIGKSTRKIASHKDGKQSDDEKHSTPERKNSTATPRHAITGTS